MGALLTLGVFGPGELLLRLAGGVGAWAAGFLAVALGGAGAGLAALFPMAAVTVGPEGAPDARVTLAATCHLGTGAALMGAASRGAEPGLWAGLGAAVAAGALVVLTFRE